MCEYCGCQAIRAIGRLTQEHDQALEYVRDAEAAAHDGDMPAARNMSAALAGLLAIHTAVEEQALFPALAGEFPEHMRELQREHGLISQTLAEVVEGRRSPEGWDHRLLEAMKALRNHIRKEQDGVFPAALASLSPTEWDRVDQARA